MSLTTGYPSLQEIRTVRTETDQKAKTDDVLMVSSLLSPLDFLSNNVLLSLFLSIPQVTPESDSGV